MATLIQAVNRELAKIDADSKSLPSVPRGNAYKAYIFSRVSTEMHVII